MKWVLDMKECDDGFLVIIMGNWGEIMECEACEWITIIVNVIIVVIMDAGSWCEIWWKVVRTKETLPDFL